VKIREEVKGKFEANIKQILFKPNKKTVILGYVIIEI